MNYFPYISFTVLILAFTTSALSEETIQEVITSCRYQTLELIYFGLNQTIHSSLFSRHGVYLHTYQLLPVNVSEALVLILVSIYICISISALLALLSVVSLLL